MSRLSQEKLSEDVSKDQREPGDDAEPNLDEEDDRVMPLLERLTALEVTPPSPVCPPPLPTTVQQKCCVVSCDLSIFWQNLIMSRG